MILVSNMLNAYSSSSSPGSSDGTLSITLPKTDYLFGETFSLTGAHVIFTPKHGNPVDVTNEVITNNSITPADNYVWDVSGQQTVRAYYTTPKGTTLYATQVVTVAEAGKGYLTVTTSKKTYLYGDQFNTSVLTITYTDAQGNTTTLDPGSAYVTISPENGSNFEVNGENTITVAYDYASESGSETAVNPKPGYVKVMVNPSVASAYLKLKQTGCNVNDKVNYNGAKLTVVYSDNTQKVVTFGENPTEDAKFTWEPYNQTVMEEAGDITINVTYTENGYSVTASSYIKVSTAKLESITFSLDKYTFKCNDPIDYSTLHLKATAIYSDSSTRDITQYVEMTPERGSWLLTDKTCVATYTENDVTKRFTRNVTVEDGVESISISLNKTQYYIGDTLRYTGSLCILNYLSGKEVQVDQSTLTWNPPAGTELTTDGTVYVTAIYNGSIHSNFVGVEVIEDPDEGYVDPYTGEDIPVDPTDPTPTPDPSYPTVNPESGDTEEVIVDPETGEVTRKTIPTSIHIRIQPTKRIYDDGDSIPEGFSDIEVELLDKDGERFTNTDYPTGIVPFSQLEFPIKVAKYDVTDSETGESERYYKMFSSQSATATEEFIKACANNGWTVVDRWRTIDDSNVYTYFVYYYI